VIVYATLPARMPLFNANVPFPKHQHVKIQ
jgi:hypothetical protein